MQKYYDNLDDYKARSKHPLIDQAICYLRMTIIFLVSVAAMFAVCGALEVA